MCHFVTGTLPIRADRAALTPILREHGLVFTPLDNAFVSAQLHADETYVRATKAYCDCGTPLGTARVGPSDRDIGAHQVRRIAELQKKGWSPGKIERWLAQQERTRERDSRVRKARDAAEAIYLETWRDALLALARRAGHVGLLLHWYRGGLETERIRLVRREEVPLPEVSVELLRGIDEDVLYDFRLAR